MGVGRAWSPSAAGSVASSLTNSYVTLTQLRRPHATREAARGDQSQRDRIRRKVPTRIGHSKRQVSRGTAKVSRAAQAPPSTGGHDEGGARQDRRLVVHHQLIVVQRALLRRDAQHRVEPVRRLRQRVHVAFGPEDLALGDLAEQHRAAVRAGRQGLHLARRVLVRLGGLQRKVEARPCATAHAAQSDILCRGQTKAEQ